MGGEVNIVISNVYSQVCNHPQVTNLLKDILRYENDYMSRRASNFKMPRYNYLINKEGLFLTGHLDMVYSYLSRRGYKVSLHDSRSIKEVPGSDEILARLSHLKYKEPPIRLREYQFDSVVKGLERKMGIFHIATGGGKTIIMSTLISAWDKKTLVLLDSKELAHQVRDELEFFTEQPIGLIGDGVYKEADITVGMVQSLNAKRTTAKGKKIKEFLSTIEYVSCDEAHHTQATSWRKVLKSCTNASIRHGFTATPLTSKVKTESGEFSNMDILLSGYLGPIIQRVTTLDLINQGYLAKPHVYIIKNELYFDGNPLQYSEEYDRIMSKDEERNDLICKIFSKFWTEGKQSIGFVSRIEHGEIIAKKLIEEYGIPEADIGFVHGSVFTSHRRDMIDSFKDGSVKILFGTVLNEGLNFFCDVGINIAGGDSNKQTIQRIGRILRKVRTSSGDVNTSEAADVIFFDFEDKGHPFFSKHARNRKKVYIAEGHKVSTLTIDKFTDGEWT
jgi:superfamily II DNA or RNA helicase